MRIPALALRLALGAALLTSWMSCLSEGPSTETGNPNLDGSLQEADGKPAAGTVKLYRVAAQGSGAWIDTSALVPPVLIKTVAVGADGRFHFGSLAPDDYAVEGMDAAGKRFGLGAPLRVHPVAAQPDLRDTIVLQAPARLVGQVTRGPDALPAGVTDNSGILVRVGGLDRFAYSDAGGYYALEKVPAGLYRLAFSAPDGHYEPKFLDSVRAAPGETLQVPLVELEWSRFQAPPAPAGLALRIDSAAGTVRLIWKAVKLGNLAHYEVARTDSADAAGNRIWTTTDTLFTDTLTALGAGHALGYRVTVVNSLGNRGPAASPPGSVTVPVPPVAIIPAGKGALAGVAHYLGAPLDKARIRLYAVAAAAGSPDSAPLQARLLDSAFTGSDGRYRFSDLPAGRYTVTADQGPWAGIRIGLAPRAEGAPPDSLPVAAPGSVEGMAGRDSLWVSSPTKGDEGIPAWLSGTPYLGFTDFQASPQGRSFQLKGVPPGAYTLVVQATPNGYFLPDSIPIRVEAGTATTVPGLFKARYNPNAPPPKIADLTITASSRAAVSLAWSPVYRYALLQGYRISRLDSAAHETARSGILTGTAYQDDISALPSGAKVAYVVRVISQAGKEGEAGGDGNANPVPFTVP